MNDEVRPHLLPFAWTMVGTNTETDAPQRLEYLARMAIDVARVQLPAIVSVIPDGTAVHEAIASAEQYWEKRNAETAETANTAHQTLTKFAHESVSDPMARLAVYSASSAARAAHTAFLAIEAEEEYFTRIAESGIAPDVLKRLGILDGVRASFAEAAEQSAMTMIAPPEVDGVFWREEAAALALRALRAAIECGPHGTVPPIRAAENLRKRFR
jgi:hypothetical protein